MKRRRLLSLGRMSFLVPALLACLVALTPSVRAAGNLEILTFDLNDPGDPFDDVAIQTPIHWADDDIPRRWMVYELSRGVIIPPTANPNNISYAQMLISINRTLKRWNETDHTSFELIEGVVPSSFFPFAQDLNPFGFVTLDGFSYITFNDPLASAPGLLGIAPSFVALRDFDLSDFPLFQLPLDPDLIDNVLLAVDFDLDGLADAFFSRTEFKRGEILDSDIAMSPIVLWELLPEDVDDLPQFESPLGRLDVEGVIQHELGHTWGACHSYLFNPTMSPFLSPETNTYDVREPDFDDRLSMMLTYPDGLLDGVGAISGSLIDGLASTGGGGELDVYQQVVFVGVPNPGFSGNIDPGFVNSHVPSNEGPIRLLAWVYSGTNAVFPAFVSAAGTLVTVDPNSYTSDYFIPALEPRSDYRVYTTFISNPPFPFFNEVSGLFGQFARGFPSEFFGGSVPVFRGVGSGVDQNVLTDNTFENAFAQAGVNAFGQFTLGYDAGPDLLFGHPVPATSFTTVRVVDATGTNDFTNQLQGFPTAIQPVTINDAGNLATGVWEIPPGVQLRQTLQLVSGPDGPDRPNDLLVTYEMRNVSSAPLSAGVRLMLDTTVAGNDGVPFVLDDGTSISSFTTLSGAAVPDTFSLTNNSFPRIQAIARLAGTFLGPGTRTPDRVVFGGFEGLVGSTWDAGSGGSFANGSDPSTDGAVAVFFDPVPIAPGATTTVGILYGGIVLEGNVPDSAVPLGATDPNGNPSLIADNPLAAEPVTVVAGSETAGINIFTNIGQDNGNTPGIGPGGPGGVVSFGRPIAPGGTRFPTDQDGSISVDVGDIDNDGDLDIVVANTLSSGQSPSSVINRLYLNGGFANEFPIGDFVDGTFGLNGLSDGPPPLGDDRLPTVADSDPITPGFQSELINESSAGINLADFDGDGYLDLFVANFGDVDLAFGNGAPNRIFMNRESLVDGVRFRHFVEETRGNGIKFRLPGPLNTNELLGDLLVGDAAFRSDVGDIDNDGDIDIVVCLQSPLGTGQTARVLTSLDLTASDEDEFGDNTWIPSDVIEATGSGFNDYAQFVPQFSMRILINDGSGYFRDDTLGADDLFGGNPRSVTGDPASPPPSLDNLLNTADRDRIPPNLWDYNNAPGNVADLAFNSEVVLSQWSGDPSLDIMAVTRANPVRTAITEGQEWLFENDGSGFFTNVTFGDSPLDPFVGGQSDFVVDQDITDDYPSGIPIFDDDQVVDYRPLPLPPTMIGIPDGAPLDQPNGVPMMEPPEVDQLPFPLETASFGGAAADLDNDGDPDLVLANMEEDPNIIPMSWGTNINFNDSSEPGFGGIDEPLDLIDARDGLTVLGTLIRSEAQVLGVVTLDDPSTPQEDPNRRTREVALGDVDRDGDPDAYFAVDGTGNEGTASAAASDYLILNNGSGQLDNDITATGITESTIKPTMDVKLADLDNDGDLDAVLAVLNDSNQYLENFLFIGPPTPTLDGDGPMFYDVTNEFMLNSIGGTTVPGDPVAFVNTTTSAGFADFDFDGDLDIYIGNGLNAVAGNNVLLFNAGKPLNEGVRVFKSANSPFPAPARVQGGGNLTSAEALNDADFNGIIDAGFGNTPTSDVLIADFDGDGEIGDGVDRNGDGRIDADYDIFVVNNGFRNSLLTNIDTVELEGASPLNLISITTGIVLTANFGVFPSTFEDPDNLGDGLMIDVTGLSLPGPTVNSPNPGYRPGTLDPSLELSRAAAAGDLNGDGRIDIYVANGSEGGIVRNTLLINQGNSVTKGNVPEFIAVNDPVDPGIFNPSSLNARNSADARIFDADSDGDLDIYVADSSASENTSHVLWINNSTPGNLRFDGVQIPIAGLNGLLLQHTTELLVADWDGDGEPTEDINGNGMLDPGEDLDHDGVIDYFDADGDGVFDADYDILLCNTNARDLMLINDGTGTFTDESLARIPDEDRNNNGFLDSGEDTDGNGQIGPVIRDTYDAATADVDLDGDLDIVLAQDFPDAAGTDQAVTLQLLINDGTGVFTDESDHEIGTTAFSALDQTGNLRPAFNANSRCVEFADMDGDGDPDLFIGNIGAVGTGVQVGAYNVVLQNRVVGTNLNARAIAGIAPGFGGPVVKFVSPPVASTTPQQVSLMIRGANFKPGARVDAGPGILHVGNIQEMGGEIIADLRILQGVEPGPRQITIINPDGARGTSQMGAFSLVDIGEGPTPTSVDSNLWSLYH